MPPCRHPRKGGRHGAQGCSSDFEGALTGSFFHLVDHVTAGQCGTDAKIGATPRARKAS